MTAISSYCEPKKAIERLFVIAFCENITSGSSVTEVIACDLLPGNVLGKPMISEYSSS